MAVFRRAKRYIPGRPSSARAVTAEPLENRTLFAFGVTQLTTTLSSAAGTAGPADVVASGNDVFFTATNPGTNTLAVWSSTGTTAGTAPITLPTGVTGVAGNLFAATADSTTAGSSVYFNIGPDAYHSDGTAAGTTAVTVPDTTAGGVTPLTVVGTFNGNVILLANRGSSQELWEQNATSNGQVDLGAVPSGLVPEGASLAIGGTFYFALGGELWSTGGTTDDVTELSSTGGTSLSDLTAVGSTLYFQSATATNQSLWSSNGTGGGTTELLPSASSISQLTPLDSQLLFVAQTATDTNGPVLWHSSGTATGTTEFSAGGGPVHVGDLGVVSGKAFFVGFATTGTSSAVLYTTAGTGLTAVRTLGTTTTPGMLVSNTPTVQVGNQAAFLAPGTNSQSSLWTSFGVTNTTDEQLPNAPAGSLASGGNGLILDTTASTATAPGQLYVLNGTSSGGSGVPITTTGALLTAAVTAVNLPATFVPGDTGTVKLTITNSGNAAENGTVAVQLFLANQGSLTSSVALTAPALANVRVPLGVGGVRTISAKFTVPGGVPVGTDDVVAVLSAVANLTPGETSTDPVTSTATATAALSFGAVGTRKNVRLKTTDSAGTAVVYALPGGGTGTLSTDANGNATLSLTGTVPSSSLQISTARGATTAVAGLSVAGSLNQITAPHVAFSGTLTLDGNVRRVTLGSVSGGTLDFDGSTPLVASLGTVSSSSLFSTDPITTLAATSWAGGTITAPSVGTFSDAGAFSGTLASAGNINTALIRGDLTAGTILAGVSLGANQALGGGDDTFTPATLRVVEVLGSVTGSALVAAGLSVSGDAFPPTAASETLLSGGRIITVSIRGTLDPTARILAATLPAKAVVQGHAVLTSGDANFSV